MLLYLFCQGKVNLEVYSWTNSLTFFTIIAVDSQSVELPPTNIVLTGLGARAMRVQWTHAGITSPIGGCYRINVTSLNEASNSHRQITVSRVDRSAVVTGLEPYRYFSSQGVEFSVRVTALNEVGHSSSTMHLITLPCELHCRCHKLNHPFQQLRNYMSASWQQLVCIV